MKNIWWSILLLVVGMGIAVFSLYELSVVGTIEKFGLVGQAGTDMFDQNELVREVEKDAWWKCNKGLEVVGSIQYYLSSGKQKIDLGYQLGETRIKCGIEQVMRGDGLSGTYKILRGARYWENSLIESEKLKLDCNDLPNKEYAVRLGTLTRLSRGNARVAIGKAQERVATKIGYAVERCIDQGSTAE